MRLKELITQIWMVFEGRITPAKKEKNMNEDVLVSPIKL